MQDTTKTALKRLAALILLAALLILPACSPGDPPRGSGSMAVYVGAEGLALYRFDTGESELLCSGGRISAPVFSPDGQYVYYKNASDVFCAPLSGGRHMLAAVNADYLCDYGGKAAFLSRVNGVTLFDPAGGEASQLISQPENGFIAAAAFSPDCSRAVYSVCLADAGRTRLIALCVTVPGSDAPDVYPAAQFPAGSVPRPVAWSPDGSACYLAVGAPDDETQELYAFSVIDGALSDLNGRTPEITASGELHVSGDGRFLLACAYKSSSDEYESLLRLDLATRSYTYLPGGYAPLLGVCISYDGSMAAYGLGETETTSHGVFVYANDKTLLIHGGAGTSCVYPSFFHDGLELYFLDTGRETVSLCRALSNSSGATKLFDGIAAPDGVYLKTLRDAFCVYDTTVFAAEAGK